MSQSARTESEQQMDPAEFVFRRFEINKVINKKRDKIKPFINNKISTGKYNAITFLPKNLFYQFSKMSNAYFLFLALLEVCFPLI
jgi:hypothetical protein